MKESVHRTDSSVLKLLVEFKQTKMKNATVILEAETLLKKSLEALMP